MIDNIDRQTPVLCRLGLGLVVLAGVSAASAAPRFGEEAVSVKAGGFFSQFDTELSLTGPSGGGGIDLEDDLQLDPDKTAYRGELVWRFAPRHRFIAGYYSFDRSSSAAAAAAIDIDDPDNGLIHVDVGVTVSTEMGWQLVPVSYAYSFVKSSDFELAGSLGVHWVDLQFGIEGVATVNGVPGTFVAQSESTSGPLPVFGVRADYAVSPGWIVGGHAQYFTLSYGDYTGRLLDLRLQTEYWFTDNAGAGLGYTWYGIDVDVDQGGGYNLGVDYIYKGVEAYLAFRF